jgi:hypothetical protein
VQALVEHGERPLEELYPILAKHYIASFDDMGGRAPGPMTGQSVRHLKSEPWDSTSERLCPTYARVAVCGVCVLTRDMVLAQRFPIVVSVEDAAEQ